MGHRFRSCIHCAFCELIYVIRVCFVLNMCDVCLNCTKYIHDDWYMNTMVGKHNLRGSGK